MFWHQCRSSACCTSTPGQILLCPVVWAEHLLDLPASETVGTRGRKKGEARVSLPLPLGLFIHPAGSATLWATRAPQVQQLCTFSVRREWGFLLGLTSGLPQLPLFLFSFSTLFYNHVNHSMHTIQSGFWLWIKPWVTCFPEELKGLRNYHHYHHWIISGSCALIIIINIHHSLCCY